jgi:acyl carrier protein
MFVLKNLVKKSFLPYSLQKSLFSFKPTSFNILHVSKKNYHPARELMQKRIPKYYSDPQEIGEEIIRIICLHDKVKDPSKVTLASSFEDIGFDSLDFIECILQIELEFGYDFGPSDWEQFITVNDVAQFLAKDFFAEKH